MSRSSLRASFSGPLYSPLDPSFLLAKASVFAIDPTVQDVLRKMAAPTGPSMQEIVIFLIVEGSVTLYALVTLIQTAI